MKFNVGDKVRILPEGFNCLGVIAKGLENSIWEIENTYSYSGIATIKYNHIRQNMFKTYLTKVEEENTMDINVTRKEIASLEQRNDKETRVCAHCGAIIGMLDDNEGIDFDGDWYCDEDCLDRETFICDHCGERHYFHESNRVHGGECVCDECLDNNYIHCEACGEYYPSYEGNWCDSRDCYVCDGCIDEENEYFRCSHCGEVHHNDDMQEVFYEEDESNHWCERCADYYASYCEECGRHYSSRVEFYDGVCEFCGTPTQASGDIANWVAPHGVRNYGYKPDPCFCMTEEQKETCDQSDLIYLGFELEMEDHENNGYNCDEDADYLNQALGYTYCKHDGSLTNGLELVSHPATLEYMTENRSLFAEAFNTMTERGYTSHNNGHCGLHFHVSLYPMLARNEHAVSNLLVLMDNLWDDLVVFSRRTPSQLDEWAQRYYTKDKTPKDLHKIAKASNGRYMAVNLKNTHTVEIRMFRGTLKLETFFATAQMVQRLVDVAIGIEDPKDAYDITWEQILDCEYEDMKNYAKARIEIVEERERKRKERESKRNAVTTRPIAVGDCVRLICDNRENQRINFFDTDFSDELEVGDAGVVRVINPAGDIGVEFNHHFRGSHNLNFEISNDNGQWIPASCLELI